MATDKRGHCPKCGRSYASWTHRRDCLGMTRAEHRSKSSRRSSSRACSAPDWGRILARPAGPVADGAFYNRPADQEPPHVA